MVQTTMRLGVEGEVVATQVEFFKRSARQERFAASAEASKLSGNRAQSNGFSWSRASAIGEPVVGSSTEIFRPFLRLRSAPDPAKVRPEKVLRNSLKCLLDEKTQPSGGWEAVREQFWSIRQDLLVQHLHRDSLAAEVSLEGARLSVKAGDVAELHRSLAAIVANGHCAQKVRSWPFACRDEVAGLRLLYLTHGGLEGHPGRLEGELLEFFKEHSCAMSWSSSSSSGLSGPAVNYARHLHSARATGNWARHLHLAAAGPSAVAAPRRRRGEKRGLFKDVPTEAPEVCGRLAWLLAKPVRKQGLAALAKAFPQGVSADRAARLLGLTGAEDLEMFCEAELCLEGKAPILVSDGRLNCSAVTACVAEQQRAAAAMARERNQDFSGSSAAASSRSSLISRTFDTGEAPIWAELQPFAVNRAEILQKMAANTADKSVAKVIQKAAKKEKKREKKKQKKEKKRLKKAKKKEKKAEMKRQKEEKKKRAVQEVSDTSSDSESSSSGDACMVTGDEPG
eukprot:TRINITY_DN29538_c0_g1_i1.p1 TRINITY_DN29538_c0_g1~~TRINITY_DN29538_c0_g1_i1.p1  ORF type:complete len:510 (+),score=128.71 TRINITY_DN29538_c0_g1_i1:71-1600(+)